jgi:hypothetical protein
MRLRLIQTVLGATFNDLFISPKPAAGNNYEISGIQSAMSAVRKIAETGVLKDEFQAVLSVSISNTHLDRLLIDPQTYSLVS